MRHRQPELCDLEVNLSDMSLAVMGITSDNPERMEPQILRVIDN
jgi:hypothetical protein